MKVTFNENLLVLLICVSSLFITGKQFSSNEFIVAFIFCKKNTKITPKKTTVQLISINSY